MKIVNCISDKMARTKIGSRVLDDIRYRAIAFAVICMIFNMMYAFYNGALGIISHSIWFDVSCLYYLLLSIMRFSAVICHQKNRLEMEYAVMKLTGVMFIALSLVMTMIVYISMSQGIAVKYGEITMITIATYTFTKITLAGVKAGKHRKQKDVLFNVVQNISYAEVAVSLLTMQRSMVASFGDMDNESSEILNALTGAIVCAFIFVLGIWTIRSSKKERN